MWKRFAVGRRASSSGTMVVGAVLAAAILSGCAAPTTTTSTSATATPVAAAAPSTPGALLAQAGRPDAPTLAALTRTFGRPDLERREGAGAILTYRLETCALVLVFAADQRNEFRLSEAS